MILNKRISMAPILLGLAIGAYDFKETNLVFNENDLGFGNHILPNSSHKSKEKLFAYDDIYLESRIKYYYDKWMKQIAFTSNIHSIVENVNFQRIVALGNDAIPVILEQLREKPSVLVWAMNLITGVKISNTNLTINEASNAWVKWGISRGIIKV